MSQPSNTKTCPQHNIHQGPGPVVLYDLDNIQGDVLVGVPKKVEEYFFLSITDVQRFRADLSKIVPLISTARDVVAMRKKIDDNKKTTGPGRRPPLLPLTGMTFGLSAFGLKKLNKPLTFNDNNVFENGMKRDAKSLGDFVDPITADPKEWLPIWKNEIDCVIDIAAESEQGIARRWAEVKHIFRIDQPGASAKLVHNRPGNVRPGIEKGHEHFGFNDGLSEPALIGFGAVPEPGEPPAVNGGVILLGHTGDTATTPATPQWTKDGSILAFRELDQLVPEFNQFLNESAKTLHERAELIGARMVGRWKSGAPVDITPLHDDPKLGNDPALRNKFDYSTDPSQARCPYAAHIRKMNPRSDIPAAATAPHRILRRGIPYGDEVNHQEAESHKTQLRRGLAFACYQANLNDGFHFLQQTWANNQNFPPQKPEVPGFDPIIGENGDKERDMSGLNPNAQKQELKMPFDFVVPRGGEYFFIPSLAAVRTVLAADVHSRQC